MFTIYSRAGCGYCDAAVALLERRKLPFTVLTLDTGQPRRPGVTYYTKPELLQKVPTAKTVPQIFHNDRYIGGYTELTHYLQS